MLHSTAAGYFHYYCHFCRSTKIVDLHLELSFPFSLGRKLHFPARWGSVFEESFFFLAVFLLWLQQPLYLPLGLNQGLPSLNYDAGSRLSPEWLTKE